jgi:LPXTG-site transpeptidase (sortase) family protein
MPFCRLKKLLALTLLLLAFPSQVSAQSFTDVPNNYKHETAIGALTDLGIIGGYDDGSFRPDQPISRAEAAKILIGAIKPSNLIEATQGELYADGSLSIFSDVQSEDWFAPYVTLAYQSGIVQGYPDGSFGPGKAINMAEGLKMILKAYNIDTSRVRLVDNPLILISPEDWFYKYFGYAHNRNLINQKKVYHPAQAMTRGEFVEILYRLKTVREAGEESYSDDNSPYSDEYTITIPRLNIINVNVEFADPFDAQGSLGVLHEGMGHYLSPPGTGRKMVLFGHSSGYSWDKSPYKYILTKIDQIQAGDMIYINYQEKGYIYQVNNKEIRLATDMDSVMRDYGYEEVALYTCWPPNGISKRYVVYATPISN